MTAVKTTWVSASYVSDRTGFSRWTVYEMARQGRIPATRVGRSIKFDVAEIDAWMAKQPKASS